MMMTFIFSYRNNNQPTAIYPFGTFPRALKKAHVMMLPSCPLWYYDDPFTPLLTWCAKLFTVQQLYSQHPFIQMTDTDVTFLPKYHNMDPDCLYVMVLTSPPSLSRSRLWAGLGVRWPSQLHPVIQGLPVLESQTWRTWALRGCTGPVYRRQRAGGCLRANRENAQTTGQKTSRVARKAEASRGALQRVQPVAMATPGFGMRTGARRRTGLR
jgi:hypothetical protein